MLEPTKVIENRHHPRVECHWVAISATMDDDSSSRSLDDLRRRNRSPRLVSNISLSASFVSRANLLLERGHIIRMEVTLPSHERLATFVEVCWREGSRFGAKFLALPEKGQTVLRQHVTREQVAHGGSRLPNQLRRAPFTSRA
jgi:hypothetical protein